MFTNSNWFAFQDERAGEDAPMGSDMMDDTNLNGTAVNSNSSSDDEVVVGEDEDLTGNNVSANDSSSSEAYVFNGFNAINSTDGCNISQSKKMDSHNLGIFQFETPSNDNPCGDRSSPEWVAWGEASNVQVGGPSVNPFDDQSDMNANISVKGSTSPVSPTSSGDSVANGSSSSASSSDSSTKSDSSQKRVVPSLFEEDVEFVGVEPEGTEKAMEQALKEGIVGEAGPLKWNLSPKKLDKENPDDGGTVLNEFNDANYWRVEQELTVLE